MKQKHLAVSVIFASRSEAVGLRIVLTVTM